MFNKNIKKLNIKCKRHNNRQIRLKINEAISEGVASFTNSMSIFSYAISNLQPGCCHPGFNFNFVFKLPLIFKRSSHP